MNCCIAVKGMDMDKTAASPIIIFIFFILRCLVPLLIMLGVSYVLRRLGLITETPPPPEEPSNGGNNNNLNQDGGLAHGKS